jgi:thiol-disulfide isomerase/thioredoxin
MKIFYCLCRLLTLFALFLLISPASQANDSASVKFIFETQLDLSKFSITLNDGIYEHKIDPKKKEWRGGLHAPFGYISLNYPNSDTTYIEKKLFFRKGYSKLFIASSPNANEYYFIDEKSSVNIISYEKMGGDKLGSYIKGRLDIAFNFYFKNKNKFGVDAALLREGFALFDTVTLKTFEFIRLHPDLYISFWTLLTDITQTSKHIIPPDTLMRFYNTALPNKYKQTEAGKYLGSVIQNKLAIISSQKFPDFSTTDINKNKIELSKLKGKYVLIQLWASWCAPCVKEMPDLKIINDGYKNSDFALISFSIDQDSSAFKKAIDKYSMNWTQVLGDANLCSLLGDLAVPQLYLIDKDGRTIYNRSSAKDPDMVLLKKMLSERLPSVP